MRSSCKELDGKRELRTYPTVNLHNFRKYGKPQIPQATKTKHFFLALKIKMIGITDVKVLWKSS